jgi:NTE family protein
LRGRAAQQLTVWKSRYENLILNPLGPGAAAIAEAIDDFANFHGDLCGPGDPLAEEANDRFLVQSAAQPTLPRLSGSRQLAPGAAEAETARHAGAPAPGAFLRTVDSIARRVAGLQVGIALGGGAAWGWAHIGVLQVLENAGIPIDVITGCSMGSVIGAFRSTGRSVAELTEIAEYWRTRTKRFIEWRFWRMCLISEKMVRKTFRGYFGDRTVNQTAIPYWANAVDIQTGKEFTIQDGSLIDCIRASIALPGLLPPFSTDGHLLVDAGITDPVPVHLVRTMGCQYAIAVNAMAELQAQPVRRRYPFNAFDVMTRCMFVMGHEIGQARAEQVADVVFTPNLGSITLLEFDRSPEIIECGRRAAEAMLPQIVAGYDKLKSRLAPALARQAG